MGEKCKTLYVKFAALGMGVDKEEEEDDGKERPKFNDFPNLRAYALHELNDLRREVGWAEISRDQALVWDFKVLRKQGTVPVWEFVQSREIHRRSSSSAIKKRHQPKKQMSFCQWLSSFGLQENKMKKRPKPKRKPCIVEEEEEEQEEEQQTASADNTTEEKKESRDEQEEDEEQEQEEGTAEGENESEDDWDDEAT